MAATEDQTTQPGSEGEPVVLPEPEPEAASSPDAPETQQPARRRAGFLAPVLGGVLAAGAGFGLAQYVPAGWPIADTASLEQKIEMQAAAIASLKTRIENLGTLDARIAGLEGQPQPDLAPLMATLADLNGRLAALEAKPIEQADSSAALAETVRQLQADLALLQSGGAVSEAAQANAAALAAEAEAKLQEAEAAAAQMRAEAEAVTEAAKTRAAFATFQDAVNSGAPFADLLPGLGLALPDSLQAMAETGVPNLKSLQDSFPDAARLALEAALRADMGDSWTERATSFFRSQTGARSLAPREGNDPDAILSRAEAALTGGDVAQALSEVSALPEPAQTAIAAWRSSAEQHEAASKAMQYIAGKIAE